MESLHRFENVLRKLVLPMFPRIGDVKVEYERAVTHDVKITYYVLDRLDSSEAFKIDAETKALYSMMGFEKFHQLWITYRSVDENNIGKEFYSR